MNHRIQCKCGALRGQLSRPQLALRGICYCKDCRAYANHLGVETHTHDAFGGAEFIATQAKYVSFSAGVQHLACLSLSEKGLLRWYSKCCGTPIGNTSRNWKVSYVGLIPTCLKADLDSFGRSFPQLQMRVNTGSAKQAPPGMVLKTVAALAGFIPQVIASGISGAYKFTPFFSSPAGTPVTAITVLSKAERERAYSAP
ncbi:DUF6151 family protein [Acidovorax sp. NCPPB 2350]|nr:DUF6151 family protein [Acidovorax sp. NCPPB 2350]